MILFHPTDRFSSSENAFLAGFLTFGNTNDIMQQQLREGKALFNKRNLFAAVNGTDPFKNDAMLIDNIKKAGFVGVHNYPTMALVDGNFGMDLDGLNQGVAKEIEFFRKAADAGLYTCGMVRNQTQAMQMARAGVDVIIFYLGLGQNIMESDMDAEVEYDIRKLKEMTSAVRKISKDVPLLFYSRLVRNYENIRRIIKEVPEINGYYLMPVIDRISTIRQLQIELEQLLAIEY